MGGYGAGYARSSVRPQMLRGIGQFVPFVALIEPGEDWTGTAGSGFASAPSDPERTTAKPAARLITVPDQYFTDELIVGVMAFANNGGTLIGGIDRVRFHFEGNSVDVLAPTFRQFTRYDGSTYLCLGYWVTLKKPTGTAGEARLYVEAIPADATMQRRVIGPYSFFPAATLHDYSVTVNSEGGADYETVEAALGYLADEEAQNPLVTITGGGPYTCHQAALFYTGGKGWATITATAPVVFSRATFLGDVDSDFRPRYDGLHFLGPNITFDMKNVRALRPEDTRAAWLDRVRFIHSDGRAEGTMRLDKRPLGLVVFGSPYFTECHFDGLNDCCNLAELVRGCTANEVLGDWAGDGRCVVYCDVYDLSGKDNWLEDVPALEVTYTGAEATATLAKSGGATALQTFTATYGANSATFEVRRNEAFYDFALDAGYDATTDGQGYFIQDVADWLNSLPGWSATVLDNTRPAGWLSLPELRGLAFTAQNVKDTTLEMVRCLDIHGDFFQHRGGTDALTENVIFAFNRGVEMAGQMFFISPFDDTDGAGGDPTPSNDFYFVGNAFYNTATSGSAYLNWEEVSSGCNRGPQSNVVIAHNSLATQRFALRADGDADSLNYTNDSYCLIANNALHNLLYTGSPLPQHLNVVIKDNVIDSGFSAPINSTGTVAAGDYTSKFADAAAGDFTPAGELVSNPKPPVWAFGLQASDATALAPVGVITTG